MKKEVLNCQFCDGQLEDTRTTFPVVFEHVVYVVEDVPTLECNRCGTAVFTQEVTERLDLLTSGPIQEGMKRRTAYVYQFDAPLVEPKPPLPKGTESELVAHGSTKVQFAGQEEAKSRS
jgi:YgiT-type zinc finger domain-containing protein